MKFVPKQLVEKFEKKLIDQAKDKFIFPTAHRRVGRWIILRWVGVNKKTIHLVPKLVLTRMYGYIPHMKGFEGKATYYNLSFLITHGSFAVYPGTPNFLSSYVGLDFHNPSEEHMLYEGHGCNNAIEASGQYMIAQEDHSGLVCLACHDGNWWDKEAITIKGNMPVEIPPFDCKEHMLYAARGNLTIEHEDGEREEVKVDDFITLPINKSIQISTQLPNAYAIRLWRDKQDRTPWDWDNGKED